MFTVALVPWALCVAFNQSNTSENYLKASYVTVSKSHPNIRAKYRSMYIQCASAEEAATLVGEYSGAAGSRASEHWLIIINVATGKGKLHEKFTKIPLEMLRDAHFTTDVLESAAKEVTREHILRLDIAKYDGIMVMGGDGTVHEVVSAMLSRIDSPEQKAIPIVAYPGGTANATAAEFGINDPTWAVFSLLKGKRIEHDALAMELTIVEDGAERKQTVFTHMNLSWGILADFDLKSDAYRWMGCSRFYWSVFLRVIQMRSYAATIEYLTLDQPSIVHDNQSDYLSEFRFKYQEVLHEHAGDKNENHVKRSGSFFNFALCKINHVAEGLILSNKIGEYPPSDELIFFLSPHSEEHTKWSSRRASIKCAGKSSFGAYSDDPNRSEIIRARALKITFQSYAGSKWHPLVGISGERFDNVHSIYAESLPRALAFIVSPYTEQELLSFL